jgi:hypothetical protein
MERDACLQSLFYLTFWVSNKGTPIERETLF